MESPMNIRFFIPALAVALLGPVAAHAERAYTTTTLALRAGPGSEYPRLERIPRDMRVEVHGCLDRFDWCDVSYRGTRGWLDGEALVVRSEGRRSRVTEYWPRARGPIVTFSFDSYWDNNYNRRSFYRDRDDWRNRSRGWRGRDQDRDGIPNRFDRDQDGDGVRNDRDRDRDGDGVRNNRDSRPNNPRQP
jgi:uncharacterized protein YraI